MTALKYHLADMLIAVLLSSLDRILIENEDVHCAPMESRIDESRSMSDMHTMQRDMLVMIFLSLLPFLSTAETMIAATVKRIARACVRSDTVVIP